MSRILTQDQIQKIFRVTEKTISRWIKKGLPHDGVRLSSRRFDGDEVAAWLKENSLTGAPGKQPISSDELLAARIRKENASADWRRLLIDERSKTLILAADVERKNVEKFTLIRNLLLQLPARASSFLVGRTAAQIENDLETRIKEILEELSRA